MKLSKIAKDKIRENVKLRGMLITAIGVGERSILNFVESDDIRLTAKAAVEAIKTWTGMPEAEILITEDVAA